MGAMTGRARIWGTANPGLWAHLDPQRPRKRTGLVLDLGRRVKPFITPEDPAAAETAIRDRAGIGPATPASRRGVVV
jgi:hypothetical protein